MAEGSKRPRDEQVGAVLVVGGGIGGVQAALNLAESGYYVYLVEQSPAIGGVMAQLDKTFPTLDCSLCILSPKLVECGRHLNIEILTNAEVQRIEGEPGDFRVTVVQQPRYVDIEKCVGCGLCAEKCPAKAPDEYNEGLSQRKAIFINYPQAVPLAYTVDKENCIFLTKGYTKEGKPRCQVCLKACAREAIDFEQTEQERTLEVGAIILTPGFDEFSAQLKGEYGYGRYPNVVTSIQFERILSASGPFQGHVQRPSDDREPKKVAFIQCVGSRDAGVGNPYCSSVCCTYAVKEAIIAREHLPEVEPVIFFMDMRTFGKGFEAFYNRAQEEYGVRFVRSRVSGVEETEDHNLRIRYETEDGKLAEEEFDLVVLSVGLIPSEGARKLAKQLGVELDEHGFCWTDSFSPLVTSRPGIFVCGVFQGPKDIPETVMQASGAVACAAGLLPEARGTRVEEKVYPEEVDVSGQEPRVGVFICHCGINIGGVVNVPEVVEYVATLPHVVFVDRNLYSCSQDTQERIKEKIREHKLNRIFVAACSPRTHEPLFRETLREAGLNPYLFEMANIRDQCSWVHMHEPDAATEKAKRLVRMGVAKCALLEPLKRLYLDVNRETLVIGGGLAGMTAALALSAAGFMVHLVEQQEELGGNLKHIHYTLEDADVQGYLNGLISKVREDERIRTYTNSKVKDIQGYVGNFRSVISTNGEGSDSEVEIEHGVVIVATGAEEYQPHEYLYGQDERVVTQRQLEEMLSNSASGVRGLNTVVMIQCVGSREKERPYCSRYCCSVAIKNARKLKEKNPNANIFILYRDLRTYGVKEIYYTRAREEGVIFIRYDEEQKPWVSREDDKLVVLVQDPLLGETLRIEPDLLVLSSAVVAPEGNRELATMLKVPLDDDGFFLEAHVKLRPVDFATDGVFVCGMAHSPKLVEETISQANAAAARAMTILAKDKIETEGIVASIDKATCTGCQGCIEVCPYNAIFFLEEEGVCEVREALCKGCGACAATCVSGSVKLNGFKDYQLYAQIEAAFT